MQTKARTQEEKTNAKMRKRSQEKDEEEGKEEDEKGEEEEEGKEETQKRKKGKRREESKLVLYLYVLIVYTTYAIYVRKHSEYATLHKRKEKRRESAG